MAGTAVLAIAFVHRTRLKLDLSQVRYVGLLKTRILPRDTISRVVRWTDVSYGNRRSDRITLLVAGQEKPAFVMDAAMWGQDVLDGVSEALDVPTDSFSSAKTAEAAFPAALPWRDRHPAKMVFLLVGILMVPILIVSAVLTAK